MLKCKFLNNHKDILLHGFIPYDKLNEHDELINTMKFVHQNHSNDYVMASNLKKYDFADAIIVDKEGICVGIKTADCLPIIVSDFNSMKFALIHAGWKGLFNGIIEKVIEENFLNSIKNTNDISISIGPCIRKEYYQVSDDFYKEWIELDYNNKTLFTADYQNKGKFFFDLSGYAKKVLNKLKINNIYDCNIDTYNNNLGFASYRKNGMISHNITFLKIINDIDSIFWDNFTKTGMGAISSDYLNFKHNYSARDIDIHPNILAYQKNNKDYFLSSKPLNIKNIDGTLDLHNLTVNTAYTEVINYIKISFTEGLTNLLIITGKGRDGTGIIKNEFLTWLNNNHIKNYIKKVSIAQDQDGGDGSFYVILHEQ
ncbi:MAG: laccase domain-containing protein [Anaplasmataceae bacterium]|nr:laccase domain-containing protein [Anaplasmataceae bacterium]